MTSHEMSTRSTAKRRRETIEADAHLKVALSNIAYCADCDRLFDIRSGCEADVREDERGGAWQLKDSAPDGAWIVAWVRFEDFAEGWTPAILIDGEWRYTYEVVPKPGIEVLAWRTGPSRPEFLPPPEGWAHAG